MPKNWLKRVRYDARSKVSLSKNLYFKSKSKWVNFRSKIRYFKPYYASIKYNFKKKVFINRNVSKRVKLNPGSVRTKKVILGAMIKPRVEFLFNSSTIFKDRSIQSKAKSKNILKLKKRYTLQNASKFAKLITTSDYTELDSKKKNTKLKLVKPLDLKNLSKNSILFNNIIELIKPKLELMSYSNKNGSNRRVRLKNKIKFMVRSKPYKFLKKLMKFTTDTYTPLIKHRKYLNRQISRDNLDIFKKNLFVDSVYMSRDSRDSYYEAMALFNSRLRPTHKKVFVFKKFYFNQRSLSVLRYPHFKRNQVNLMRSFSVDGKKVSSIKGTLKKKVKKTLFAYAMFNYPKLTSKKMNFILGRASGLKKTQNTTQSDVKKTKLIEDFTKTNTFTNSKALKKNLLNTDRLLTKLDKVSLFCKKQKTSIPESNSHRALLLDGLEKKIKERKHTILGSLLRSKPIKVFRKNINALNLSKYRYIRLKQLSYLSVKAAPKLKYLGFKKLKRFFKLNTVKLTLKRKAIFLNERRLKAPNQIEKSTLSLNKRVFMLYKNDSKKYKYKRKFYKPINFDTYGFSKENKAIKKLLLSSKNKYKDGSLKKDVRFLNKDKPQLVLLGSSINTKKLTKEITKGPKSSKINNKLVKTKKKIPFLYKLHKITENFKKSRMGKEYKYIPGVNLYQGKAYNFRSKLVRMCNFLNNKADKNLSTYIKMHKRSNSHLVKLASQRLKRRIFFGLNYNVETRYSLALKKKYLKKTPRNPDMPYNKRELIRSDVLRNSNNLPINIGRSIRSKKLKKTWKAALRNKKDEFSSSFRKKLNLFKRIIKGRSEPVLSSSSLKKKTLNFNIKLLNTNSIFKKSNWKLNLLSSLERYPAYLDLNNLSIFKYKEFAIKLFKLYTQLVHFGRFDSSINKINATLNATLKGKPYFNLNFSYLDANRYPTIDKGLFLPLKNYAISKVNVYLFRKNSLSETYTCNQVKSAYFKVKKNLINIDKAVRISSKKRKKVFIVKSNSIRNKYSKGYKIFLLNRFRLQLNAKSNDMASNNQQDITSKLHSFVAISLTLAASFFSLTASARLPMKIEARTLDTLKGANFNRFSNKLSYLLLNNLLLKPKSKMIKFNKLFFNFKNLPIEHRKMTDFSLKGLSNQPETKSHKYLSLVLRPKKTKTKLKLNNFLNNSVFFMWDLIASSVIQSRFSVVNLDLINFICKSKNIVRVIAKKMVGMLFFEFRNLTPTFFIREVIYLTVISIRYKDTALFMNWLTMYMNKIEIKKHKKVIAFLRKLVRLLRKKNYFYRLGCLGFFFDIRGKVGVTGNKKKRNYVVKYGTSSSSNKNVRWSLDKNIIRTTTGVLGTTLIITY